jgi:hypothetical protein
LRLPVVRFRKVAKRRLVRRIVVTWAILCVVWLAVSSIVACTLTHRLVARAEEVAPSPAWGRLESYRLETKDGEDLGAWFIAGVRFLESRRPGRPVIVDGSSMGAAAAVFAAMPAPCWSSANRLKRTPRTQNEERGGLIRRSRSPRPPRKRPHPPADKSLRPGHTF